MAPQCHECREIEVSKNEKLVGRAGVYGVGDLGGAAGISDDRAARRQRRGPESSSKLQTASSSRGFDQRPISDCVESRQQVLGSLLPPATMSFGRILSFADAASVPRPTAGAVVGLAVSAHRPLFSVSVNDKKYDFYAGPSASGVVVRPRPADVDEAVAVLERVGALVVQERREREAAEKMLKSEIDELRRCGMFCSNVRQLNFVARECARRDIRLEELERRQAEFDSYDAVNQILHLSDTFSKATDGSHDRLVHLACARDGA